MSSPARVPNLVGLTGPHPRVPVDGGLKKVSFTLRPKDTLTRLNFFTRYLLASQNLLRIFRLVCVDSGHTPETTHVPLSLWKQVEVRPGLLSLLFDGVSTR